MQYHAMAQHGQRKAKLRTAMSDAYQCIARLGTHHYRPAIDTYKKKFGVCDLFNRHTSYMAELNGMLVRSIFRVISSLAPIGPIPVAGRK